ncbi:GL19064 [Drosophila persimilis]|uniref:GL19064 n=2 Tax=Drosophila persimilis TaxID=7234 RepID=B4G6I2_DROPE|nr:GL19064 [Drosophila persimilis]
MRMNKSTGQGGHHQYHHPQQRQQQQNHPQNIQAYQHTYPVQQSKDLKKIIKIIKKNLIKEKITRQMKILV